MAPGPGSTMDLGHLARQQEQLARRLRGVSGADLSQAVVDVALEMIPSARWSSITMAQGAGFRSLVASDDTARRIDAVQYMVDSGPCLDSIRHGTIQLVEDLTADTRWPQFAAAVLPQGVRSVLAHRLHLSNGSTGGHGVAALNVYADRVDAFDEDALWVGAMLASHGSLGVSLALSGEKLRDMEQALRTNREIGTAVGVLMGRHSITRDQALELLRLASQDTNRKVVDVAAEVVLTGELTLPNREATRRGDGHREEPRG